MKRQTKIFSAILLILLITSCTVKKTYNENSSLFSDSIDQIALELKEKYIIPEISQVLIKELYSKKNKLVRAKTPLEFENKVDKILRKYDKHMYIDYNPEWIAKLSILDSDENERKKRELRIKASEKEVNYGFESEILNNGEIGYIKISEFFKSDEAFEKFKDIIKNLKDTKNIVLDLRSSRGGHPEMVAYICSYFFKSKKHINTIYYRYKNQTIDYYTSEVAPNLTLVDQPLFILTDKITFSAAEGLAYHLRHLNRAKIVGEKTRGGAHPTEEFALNDKILFNIATGKAINPITKSNWEKKGIKPDYKVKPDKALDKVFELIKKP